MKRVITSFKNANKDVLREISFLYPKGVEDDDLINFPTVNGGTIRALEIEVGDSLYLVKMENESYYKKYLAKDDSDDEDEEGDDSDSDFDGDDVDMEFDDDEIDSDDSDEDEEEDDEDDED